MAQYPKPSGSSGTFNNGNFNNNQSGGLTIAEGLKYFVSFPKTQTPSTITANNFTTTGNLDVAGDSQFGGDVNFLGGVSITGGIVFKDDVEVQGTTTLDDTLLCLNDATIDGELTITNNVILEPNALTPTVAPYLELTNGIPNEYCHLYLDPQVGYDMTLYTNQNPGGGLTIRGANGASFTMNPATVQDGYGCQFQNPVSMNGNTLSGLNYLVANNGSYITLVDDINMNNNNITSATNITSTFYNVGAYGQIAVNPSNNPTILSIANTSTASSAQIYFQMFNTGGVGIAPMNMTTSNVYCNIPLNLTNGSDINMGSGSDLALGANSITGTGTINGNVHNINTYGKIDQSGTNNGIVVANNAPYVNGAQATIAFNLNGPTGITTPFKIYNDGLNSIVNLNMNNANINGINTLTGYAGGNITLGSYINMNSNNILNCGAGSTAYTQPDGTNNTTIATTAYVANNSPIYAQSSFTNVWSGCSITPATVNVITTRIASTNIVSFNNVNFTVNSNQGLGNTMICQLQFNTAPWATYPPASGSATSITIYCNSNGINYSCPCVWYTSPNALWIGQPTNAPTNASTFTVNLSSFGAFAG